MTRIRARVAIIALIAVLPAALAGCGGGGGGGGSEDPNQVLDQTFNNPTKVTSGNLDISLNGTAEGTQSGSLTATIAGPFQGDASNPTTFPQLDLTAKVSASGAGQSFNFDGGLIATKDNAYVEYQGQAYEVGSAIFQQFKTAYEQSAKQGPVRTGQPERLLDLRAVRDRPEDLADERLERGRRERGRAGHDPHPRRRQHRPDRLRPPKDRPADAGRHRRRALTPAQLDQVKSAIKDASVDVYSGTDDHLLRKLSLSLSIAPPAELGS